MFSSRVLSLIQNNESLVQGAPTHVGQRSNLDDSPFHVLLNFVRRHHVLKRVVEWAQIRIELLVKVARQESQGLACLDGGAGQNNAPNSRFFEGIHSHGHGQVGLSGACRADTKGNVMLPDCRNIALLADGLGRDGWLLERGTDLLMEECLKGGRSIVLHHLQGVGEISSLHGGSVLLGRLEQLE